VNSPVRAPLNKDVMVAAINATAGGTYEVDVVGESDYLQLTCFPGLVAAGVSMDITVELVGDPTEPILTLARFPQLRGSAVNVTTLAVPTPGRVRVRIEYTGTAALQLRGRAMQRPGLDTTAPAPTANPAAAQHRQELICLLHDIRQLLTQSLNHQRAITGIESDKGESY
jgi:hypothetical protein